METAIAAWCFAKPLEIDRLVLLASMSASDARDRAIPLCAVTERSAVRVILLTPDESVEILSD